MSFTSLMRVSNPEVPSAEALEQLKNSYPKELLEYLPLEKLYSIPEFVFKDSYVGQDSIGFPFSFVGEDVYVVRGTAQPSGRSFIAVRYVNEEETSLQVKVETLFRRYAFFANYWESEGTEGSCIHPHVGAVIKEDFEYLARLILVQPCGSRKFLKGKIHSVENAVKTHFIRSNSGGGWNMPKVHLGNFKYPASYG